MSLYSEAAKMIEECAGREITDERLKQEVPNHCAIVGRLVHDEDTAEKGKYMLALELT
jgi:hypothetical protein